MSRCLRLLPVLLLVALGGVLGLSVRSDERPAEGKKYALLIGVRDYDHASLKALRFTENDVEELTKVLEDKGGFTSVRVLTTTRGKAKAEDAPTGPNVRLALKGLLAKKKSKDIILIALAGHGVQLKVKAEGGGKRDEGFFCPADSQLNDASSMLSLTELFEDLKICGAGVKLLLMDACRNDVAGAEARNVDVAILPRPPKGMAALFSCASGERAFETAKLGTKGHGVFFHYVLKGLAGDARNRRGEVTWDHLTAYVKGEVPRAVVTVVGAGAQQSPHLVTDLVGEPPVLVRVDVGVVGREDELKIDGPKGPQSLQVGNLKASASGDEGVVRFSPPFTGQPAVTFSNTQFAVVEVKRTHFKWRHVDTTPSAGTWTARGPGAPDALDLTGELKAKVFGEEGEARFTTPFARPPSVVLSASYFSVVETTKIGFRWKHVDTTPSTAKWTAFGVRSGDRGPVVKGPGETKIDLPKRPVTTQSGPLRASTFGDVGVIRFSPPFKAQPKVTISARYFEVVEVTKTELRWKHVDNTPSTANWTATGPGAPDALQLSGDMAARVLNEEGAVVFPAPFAAVPIVDVNARYFAVLETTKTGFRWKHLDNTATTGSWSARGVLSPYAPAFTTAPQSGPLNASVFGEEGVVRFPVPYKIQPTVTISAKYFTIVETTPAQFRWRHVDKTPSTATWRASIGAPDAPPPPVVAQALQFGPLSASAFGQESVVRFSVPYKVPPTVLLNNSYFAVSDVTTTQFRWKHLDKTPSNAIWTAHDQGPGAFVQHGLMSAKTLNEDGVIRFPTPYSAAPTVALSNGFFRVVEATPTELRWKHLDSTPSFAAWAAVGKRSGDAPVPTVVAQSGPVNASTLGEEGIVRFPTPHVSAPTVTFSANYFQVVEVTRTQFKWRHLDTTPTNGTWTARPAATDTLRASALGEEGVVRFGTAYAVPPTIALSNHYFRVTEVTTAQFRWKHLDTTPSAANWKAQLGRPAGPPLGGTMKATVRDEEGTVRFSVHYGTAPTITFSNRYFEVSEVTPTYFRWKHLDNTPSTVTWAAHGPDSFGHVRAKVRDEEGVVRFLIPFAVVPNVTLSNSYFKIVEVTKTELRWKHVDNTPSAASWTAQVALPDALEQSGNLSARDLDEEGMVRFTTPYMVPPTVTPSNSYFRVIEVTPAYFRWKHLDRTPSNANWTAHGVRPGAR